MKINKLIVCVASFASVGFASDGLFDGQENRENCKIGNVGSKPVKRERPAGGSVSMSKSIPGVDRPALADVTSIVDGPRHRKPNSFINSDHIDGLPAKPKATSDVLSTRKKVKAKRAGATVLVVHSDNSSGHTTLEKDSVSSRASSFDSSGASSPILTNDDFGFGFDFDLDLDNSEDRILASPVVTTPYWNTTHSALTQKETPFELGGSYKGDECSPFYLAASVDLLSLSPLSPVGSRNDEFARLVEEMSSN